MPAVRCALWCALLAFAVGCTPGPEQVVEKRPPGGSEEARRTGNGDPTRMIHPKTGKVMATGIDDPNRTD
jgi:hypothetical protein